MSHLAPCPACNRHVDVAETACPFCAVALSASFRAQPPLVPLRGRLGRAALMAAGATLMGAAACSSNDSINSNDAATDRPPISRDAADDRGLVAAYGGPLPGTGGTGATGGTTGTGGATGSGGVSDAGSQGALDAAPERDASQDRTFIAIYGAPFAADEEPTS